MYIIWPLPFTQVSPYVYPRLSPEFDLVSKMLSIYYLSVCLPRKGVLSRTLLLGCGLALMTGSNIQSHAQGQIEY